MRTKLKVTLKDNKKRLDFLMSLIIFVAVILEYLSWTLQTDNTATITDVGDNYLVFWHPFLSSLTIWVFSWFFLIKVLRYKACIYSQIVSVSYWLVQTISVSAFVFQIGDIYDKIVYPILLFVILFLILIKAVRWCISK